MDWQESNAELKGTRFGLPEIPYSHVRIIAPKSLDWGFLLKEMQSLLAFCSG